MIKDILCIILMNDINSIKKLSLLCKNWTDNISLLKTDTYFINRLTLLAKYPHQIKKCMSEAALYGYIDIVQLMIEKGGKYWNWTMANAAIGGHLDIVQLMIDKGAHYLQRSVDNAANKGHKDIVIFLINRDTYKDINVKNICYYIAQYGYIDIIQLIITRYSSRYYFNHSMIEAVTAATMKGQIDVVKFMIDKKLINNCDREIDEAAYYGHINIVQYLIEKFKYINLQSMIENATRGDHINIIQLFYEKGLLSDINWHKIFDIAIYNGRINIFQWIIDKFSLQNIDWTMAFKTAFTNDNINIDIVKFIIDKCELHNILPKVCCINSPNCSGILQSYTVYYGNHKHGFHRNIEKLAFDGNITFLQFIIEKFDVNNNLIKEIITNSLKKGHLNIIMMIMEKRDISQYIDWNMMLVYAVDSNNIDVVNFVIENIKYSISKWNQQDINHVVSNNNINIVNFVIENKKYSISKWNQQAINCAVRNNNINMVKFLIEYFKLHDLIDSIDFFSTLMNTNKLKYDVVKFIFDNNALLCLVRNTPYILSRRKKIRLLKHEYKSDINISILLNQQYELLKNYHTYKND
jgi:ankyrin repeat protein/intracellular sulfur oxidation DsrE/DsrF family protein